MSSTEQKKTQKATGYGCLEFVNVFEFIEQMEDGYLRQ